MDKQNKVGGKMETLATPSEKDTFLFFRDYLYNQYVRLGIKFVQQDVKSHDDIKDLNPDAVIIATGASQTVSPIKGIDSKNVVLAEDVLNGDVKVGSTVAIIGSGLVGTETAKHLDAKGIKVHIIEMMDAVEEGFLVACEI